MICNYLSLIWKLLAKLIVTRNYLKVFAVANGCPKPTATLCATNLHEVLNLDIAQGCNIWNLGAVRATFSAFAQVLSRRFFLLHNALLSGYHGNLRMGRKSVFEPCHTQRAWRTQAAQDNFIFRYKLPCISYRSHEYFIVTFRSAFTTISVECQIAILMVMVMTYQALWNSLKTV